MYCIYFFTTAASRATATSVWYRRRRAAAAAEQRAARPAEQVALASGIRGCLATPPRPPPLSTQTRQPPAPPSPCPRPPSPSSLPHRPPLQHLPQSSAAAAVTAAAGDSWPAPQCREGVRHPSLPRIIGGARVAAAPWRGEAVGEGGRWGRGGDRGTNSQRRRGDSSKGAGGGGICRGRAIPAVWLRSTSFLATTSCFRPVDPNRPVANMAGRSSVRPSPPPSAAGAQPGPVIPGPRRQAVKGDRARGTTRSPKPTPLPVPEMEEVGVASGPGTAAECQRKAWR